MHTLTVVCLATATQVGVARVGKERGCESSLSLSLSRIAIIISRHSPHAAVRVSRKRVTGAAVAISRLSSPPAAAVLVDQNSISRHPSPLILTTSDSLFVVELTIKNRK